MTVVMMIYIMMTVMGGRIRCLVFTLSLITVHITLHAIITIISTELRVFTLEGFEILTSLGELTLLHTLTHVPVDECTLGEHEIELLVHAAEHLADGSGVGLHAHSTRKSRHVAAGDNHGRTAVETSLETSRTPVDKLDGALVLDLVDGNAHILGHDITTIHEAASHVLALARIALHKGVGRVESGGGDLLNRVLLVRSTRLAHERSIGGGEEVDARMRDQVDLELVDIHVERALKAERGSKRRNNLRDETVQVGVGRTRNVEVATADVIKSLVIHEEGAVSVLQHGVGGEDGVVGLDDSAAELRRGPDNEVELALLAVVGAETLEQKAGEAGASATTDAVEDEEALEASAVVSELADAIESDVDQILADGVVATGKVVGSILTAADELVGVVEAAVGAVADLVNNAGLEIDEDGAWHKLPAAGLAEEGAQGIILVFFCKLLIQSTVRADAVLKAEELPGGVAGLDTSLANMNHDAFSHFVM